MRRFLRSPRARLVAVLTILVSLLLAGPAHAAPGPWKNATVLATNPITEALDVTCQITLRQSGIAEIPGIEIGANGYCTAGPDITPGGAQAGESGSGFALSVDGLTAAGVPCNGMRTGNLGPHPANGTTRVAGSIPAGFINISQPCSIQRIGIRFEKEGGGLYDVFTWQGVDVPAVEDEDPVANGCPVGIPQVSWTIERRHTGPNWYDPWIDEYFLNTTIVGAGVSTGQWGYAIRNKNQDGGTAEGVLTSKVQVGVHYPADGNAPYVPAPPTRGVELYAVYPGGVHQGNIPMSQALSIPGAGQMPPDVGDPFYGWSDPSECRFYFGPRVLDDGNSETTGDEPYGDGVTPPPPPPTEDPEPEFEDPTPIDDSIFDFSWLWAILEALRRAIAALASAVGAIARAILDGLKALFIPDTDNWGVEELVDQLQAKPPFSLLAGLEDETRAFGIAYRSSGSCGVIANFGNGMQINCATIAGIPGMGALHSVISAGLFGLTGWGIFRQISRLFEEGQ